MATTVVHPIIHPPTGEHRRHGHLISTATSLSQLKQIHAHLIKHPHLHHHYDRLLLSAVLLPSTTTTYALSVFSSFPYSPSPNLVNKLFKFLSRSGDPESSLLFFRAIVDKSFPFDRFTFPPLLKAASKALALEEGRVIHGLASKLGFCSDPFVETALIGMYGACGQVADARLMFDKMSYKDVVTWNIMIDGYCQCGLFNDVLELLEEMKNSNVEPDERIFTTILSACSRSGNLEVGGAIHRFISQYNIGIDSHLQSALLNMYACCGAMDVAQTLYDSFVVKTVVASTAMISGYSKAGQLKAARSIFDQMLEKDLVCWSTMIAGYAESDTPEESLCIFQKMQDSGIKPDQVTMLSVISACAQLGVLGKAKQIHNFVNENGFGNILPVHNALIDMYAKCGSIEGAKQVFNQMHKRNVISWTSMITAFAVHGEVENALNLFHHMKYEGIEPNSVTFVGVLYACSHAGLLEEGEKLFASMVNDYGITPKLEHYGCLVDLYGRANRLRDALVLVESMPMAPNVVIWGSLMAASRIHGEFELGEFAAKRLLELDPDHDGAHILLSNIYAGDRRWEDVGKVRKSMKYKSISKERGCSKIELNNEIHQFLTADRTHKLANDIYEMLYKVVDKLSQVGYAPDTSSVVVDLYDEEKRKAVLWHSEKLALSYGLIVSETGSCIRIIKNLRICEDCHNFMKLASKVFKREIVVRDRTRFHHCKDGSCSCKDYW